jgi:protein gp37
MIEFCVWLGKSGSETLQLINQAYGDDAMRWAGVFKWWKNFRDGETNVKDEPHSSKPRTVPVLLSSRSLQQTVCSMFLRSVWSVIRSASLAKGGTSKKRPSPHLHKVPTRNNMVSPRTFQTALVYNIKCQEMARKIIHIFIYIPLKFRFPSD